MRSKYFKIEELIDKATFQARGEKAWELLDYRIVQAADLIREGLGKSIIVNDWHKGGKLNECGLRDPLTATGSKYSQHKFGRALDLHVQGMEPEAVRHYIRQQWKRLGVNCIEKDTPSWVHIDNRWTGLDALLEVPYK